MIQWVALGHMKESYAIPSYDQPITYYISSISQFFPLTLTYQYGKRKRQIFPGAEIWCLGEQISWLGAFAPPRCTVKKDPEWIIFTCSKRSIFSKWNIACWFDFNTCTNHSLRFLFLCLIFCRRYQWMYIRDR